MSSNAGQISENTLQAMEIVAQSVVDRTETTITKDCVVAEIIDSATGAYLVSSGYSSFTAYSLNKTQYKVGDLVYVQMPNAQNDGDKIILGMRQTGDDAYELADNFADVVFFNGRNDSLIKLHGDVGLIANDEQLVAYLGSWTGEYSGVTKIGIEGSFVTILKALGVVEGTYGLKLRVMNNVGAITEYDFPCSEYYGNPYNYIYSTRVNQVFTLTTQTTVTRIEAYVYQDADFYNENDRLVAVVQTSNIILTDLYVGVGKLTSEVLDSKFTIKANSGSTVYQKDGDAELNAQFDTLLHNICSIENPTEESVNNVLEDEFINFTSVQKTRINLWLEENEIIKQIVAGDVREAEWKGKATNTVLRELSIEVPQIGFSLLINTDAKPEYLTSLPSFDTSTTEGRQARNLFIRWYRRNREATIDDINLPDDLHSGWELTGQFDKDLNPMTDDGYLIFTPDYEANDETLVALVYYKNKYYMSNQLTLINRVDAKNDQIEEIKKDLIDQAEKDRELIDANKRAVNALIIESGYYVEDEDGTTAFNNNNGLYYYYTRSGLIRESEKLRNYGLRCHSSDKDTIIKSLTWGFPSGNTMAKANGAATAEDGYYKQLITIDRKYNPGKTNNIVTVTAICDITVRDESDNIKDVYENVTIENQIELLFGYYSCEGTEHSLTAYWTNSAEEVVNCLIPGKTYKAHLLLDGKEVTSPTWFDTSGVELRETYTPTINDIHMRKGVVSISDAEIDEANENAGKTDTTLRLGCWLGAKISYNEDNIIEGMTQLIYQSDGTTHMRDGTSEADVIPQYRLELLLEDGATHNQQYADGIYWDPYTGEEIKRERFNQIQQELNNIEHKTNDENKENEGQKKELVNGFLYDADGEKPVAYFSGPSNWSIGIYGMSNRRLVDEYFMRDVNGDYETWKNGTSVECPYFSLVYNPSAKESSLIRSTVDLQPKGVYFETMSDYIFSINVYTYTGYILARIPLRIDINRYPSIYIDKMAKYDGGIKIDETLGTIYAPRFLAGRYEAPDNVGSTGNKQFSGVAIGDFADKDTEASMAIPGIYGFKQGQQAYAFRNNGTGFIGANSNTRITFNNGGSNKEVLTIGNINRPVFSVEADGDVNLTGSVTGGSAENGYHLDKDGSGYIISSPVRGQQDQYGIYFQPGDYPIYISNSISNKTDAAFSVRDNGDLNLNGGSITINNIVHNNSLVMNAEGISISDGNNAVKIKSDGISLTGSIKFDINAKNSVNDIVDIDLSNYATKDDISGAKYELTADKLKAALDSIDGNNLLTYDNQGNLYIKATALAAQYLESDVIDVHGALRTRDYDLNFVTGRLGSGRGMGDNDVKTYGVGMAADPLYPTQLGPHDVPAEWEDGTIKRYLKGGYAFVTEGGARVGYYSTNKNHTALVVAEGQVYIQYFENGVQKQGATLWTKT